MSACSMDIVCQPQLNAQTLVENTTAMTVTEFNFSPAAHAYRSLYSSTYIRMQTLQKTLISSSVLWMTAIYFGQLIKKILAIEVCI